MSKHYRIITDWKTDTQFRSRLQVASAGTRIVFVNGCFDVFHAGHALLLTEARKIAMGGGTVIVGLNSDHSARRLKGEGRPVFPFEARALVLASMRDVDFVVGFDEDTPEELIQVVRPNTLVKSEQYKPEDWFRDRTANSGVAKIPGARSVLQNGGVVHFTSHLAGVSTSVIRGGGAVSIDRFALGV